MQIARNMVAEVCSVYVCAPTAFSNSTPPKVLNKESVHLAN